MLTPQAPSEGGDERAEDANPETDLIPTVWWLFIRSAWRAPVGQHCLFLGPPFGLLALSVWSGHPLCHYAGGESWDSPPV